MKPSLVFVSPVIPSFSGNGLAMRAAQNLRALAARYEIHLLVITLYGRAGDGPEPEVLKLCQGWKWIDAPLPASRSNPWSFRAWWRWGQGRPPPEWSAWTAGAEAEARRYFEDSGCSVVWLFRFYLLPWVLDWREAGHPVWLDLDELESTARARQAELLFSTKDEDAAARLQEQVKRYRRLEKKFLPGFTQIITSSNSEAESVNRQGPQQPVSVWPNVVEIPPELFSTAEPEEPMHRLLFIGSFGHFPNRDAAHVAAREIVPSLAGHLNRPVVLQIAGANAEVFRSEFEAYPHVAWRGTVLEVGSLYAATDLVLVPLRAGGGTRIKILEAFAHGKAVVSTRLGAEGLDVADGRELLLADTPEEFVRACAHLLNHPEERNRMSEAARKFVRIFHPPEVLRERARALG